MVARVCTALVLAGLAVVATAAPAAAHTVSGPRPTDFRSTVVAVTPRVAGVRVRVVDLGNKLELTNASPADVVVLGYAGEPYLRVGPRGVFENRRSPATYLDRTRAGTTPVPAIARHTTASTPPDWHRVSGGRTVLWHDHRAHWMGAGLPPSVRGAQSRFHDLGAWTVPLRVGTRAVAVRGRLSWVPGPSGRPWLLLVVAAFVVAFAAARSRRVAAGVALLLVIVANDVTHTVTAELARPGSALARTAQFLGDNFVSVLVWAFAALAVVALVRRRVEALYGVLLVGVMVALVSGLTDLSYWWSSQLPAVGPDVLARGEVALALGLGAGAAAGALASLRRPARAVSPAPVAAGAGWTTRLVAGLDERQVEAVCARLDAAEVIPLALGELARRVAPAAAAFGDGALVLVVLAQDEVGEHVWSLVAPAAGATAGATSLRVRPGAPAPSRAEVHTTFPVLLQLLAGTRTLAAAEAAGAVRVHGDRALLAAIEPYLVAGGAVPAAR